MGKVHRVLISAAVALVLLVVSLIFIGIYPWSLIGLPLVLKGIAAIIRAINSTPTDENTKDAITPRDRTMINKRKRKK